MPNLQIQNLTMVLSKDMRTLVKDFSFTLNVGDRAAIIGEEGNGKSTLLKLLHDESLVEGYAGYEGRVIKSGLRTGLLLQELPEEQKAMNIRAYFEALPFFDALSDSDKYGALREVGLDAGLLRSERPVSTLSGGEKVKLQLAAILTEKPDVLLLDEPSNDIDIETLIWLERFINGCGRPVLYVSHDETLVENTANVILHLEQVRRKTVPRHTVARMPYGRYVAERMSAIETQSQLARKEKEERGKKLERWRQIYQRVEHELDSISRADPGGGRLLKKKMKAVKSQEKRYEREAESMTQPPDFEEAIMPKFPGDISLPRGKTVLDLKLDALSAGGRLLARDIALRVSGGEHVCVTGANGAGKSTLLRLIAKTLLGRSDLRAAYMPQNYGDLLAGRQTPVEFLAPGGKKGDVTTARTYLGSMKYTPDEMEHDVGELSSGQRAKLFFVKMILDRSDVLILDEPTRNFSPLSNPVIRGILRDFRGTIISASHDRKYIAEVCDKVYELTEEGLNASVRPENT